MCIHWVIRTGSNVRGGCSFYFKSKLKNAGRTAWAEKYGVSDSQWLNCPEVGLIVSTTIPTVALQTDRAASWLQNLWLDAVNPLVYVLEKAEELELPAEVIGVQVLQPSRYWRLQIGPQKAPSRSFITGIWMGMTKRILAQVLWLPMVLQAIHVDMKRSLLKCNL